MAAAVPSGLALFVALEQEEPGRLVVRCCLLQTSHGCPFAKNQQVGDDTVEVSRQNNPSRRLLTDAYKIELLAPHGGIVSQQVRKETADSHDL